MTDTTVVSNTDQLSTNYKFINISERAYKYIRQFTIKSVDDAIVELITNAIDAYNKTSYETREIIIEVYNGDVLRVIDKALGLTSDQLDDCFLQVGNYTASDTSRGFFSRGAKDISALGDVYFDTIKDSKYSQCVLDTDAYGLVTVSDVDVTDQNRRDTKIPAPNNGLCVTLNLLPNFQDFNIDLFYDSCCKMASLRDIMSDIQRNFIYLRKYEGPDNTLTFDKRVFYNYPINSELLLDLVYTIPNYPDETARFTVYKTSAPIQQPNKESMLEFGFLIKDSASVYEINTIDDKYRWNPYINYLYGSLYSDSINKYLKEFDEMGPTDKNPYPVIDPSRLTGVNKLHPLIIQMYTIPLLRLDQILRDLNKSISSKAVTIEDMNEILDELSLYSLNIIKQEDIQVNFLPTYDGQLIKAIEDDRAKYVSYEKSYQLVNDYSVAEMQIDNYMKEEIIKITQQIPSAIDNYFYLDEDSKLVQIQNLRDDDPLTEPRPIDILKLLSSRDLVYLQKKPYVYKLSNNGTLAKLYIFQKGVLDQTNTDLNDAVNARQRMFTIEFINDLNLQERYIIDNTDGIRIKLNLNNPMIAKYLTQKSVGQIADIISLAVLTSTQSLIFLKELITDVLADLVLDSDIMNNKLTLDGTSYNNVKKAIAQRNKIISKLEIPIDIIFDKYVNINIKKKVDNLTGAVQNVSDVITSRFGEDTDGSLALLKAQFTNLIHSLVE